MDEFNTRFAIDDLIIKDNIEIKTIHLLSENDQFIIAVSWLECDEAHFKMFKNQDISNIESICYFLLDYDQVWYNLIQNWIAKPLLPLCLKANKL